MFGVTSSIFFSQHRRRDQPKSLVYIRVESRVVRQIGPTTRVLHS